MLCDVDAEKGAAVAAAIGAAATYRDCDVTDEAAVQAAVGATVDELGSIDGGMRPKLGACVDAIRGGAQSAHIIDGRKPHSLLLELFTDAGIGTMVTP